MSYFDPFASIKIHQQSKMRTRPTESTNQFKVVHNERLKPNNAVSTSNYANTNFQNGNTDIRREGENSVEFRVANDQGSLGHENHTTDLEKQNAACAKSASDIEPKNSSVNFVSSHVPSLDDYFDPFVKLRPASSSPMATQSSLHSSCANTDDIVMKDSSTENSGKLEVRKYRVISTSRNTKLLC